MNGDDKLPRVTENGLNSGVEVERLLVRKSEGGKTFD